MTQETIHSSTDPVKCLMAFGDYTESQARDVLTSNPRLEAIKVLRIFELPESCLDQLKALRKEA